MDQKIVRLSTEEELRIFMMPMRQKLIRVMSLEGKSMTAKNLADKLNISASAVQNHIRKLEKIGLIEHAETNAFFVLLTNCRKGCEAVCILRMMTHVYHFCLATI